MQRPPKKTYDLSFQQDAVALLARTDRSLREVARDLGLPQSTLFNWYDRDVHKKKKNKQAPNASSPSAVVSAVEPAERIAQLEREVEALRKKNEQLEMDRAILKKAAAFFAKESE